MTPFKRVSEYGAMFVIWLGLVLLFGAQVIAEYERISQEPIETSRRPVKLDEP